jgi:hypothetical protein
MNGYHASWDEYVSGDKIGCPKCGLLFKPGTSNTEKNPGKRFFSCNSKFNGCGFFGWLDAAVKGGATGTKRERAEGTVITGTVAKAPTMADDTLARIADDVIKCKDMLNVICHHLELDRAK